MPTNRTNHKQPYGVGGWLLFYIIGSILGLFKSFYQLHQNYTLLDTLETWQRLELVTPNIANNFAEIIKFENCTNLILIAYGIIVVGLLLASKKKIVIDLVKGYFIARITIVIIDYFLTQGAISSLPLKSEQKTSIFSGVLVGVIVSAIWLAYFSVSKRIRNTFTEK